MKYKIDIHTHSIFSDGISSPYVMAVKANRLGFSALVITDHFYGRAFPEFMSTLKLKVLKKACIEARAVLPIIVGLEVPFMGQEVLVFGGAAIKSILANGKPDMEGMLQLKKDTGCAVVLCHPSEDFSYAVPAVDGFERFNSGMDMFGGGERSLDGLSGKQGWCNGDAHRAVDIGRAYNVVGSKIETEADLIKYIKRGQQPEFYIEKND